MALVLEAFAKVNLSLRVLGRRADGFHEIDTLFQTVDLSDVLTFEASDSLELSCTERGLPTGEENLVIRAARLLAEAAGRAARGRIHLVKRIPAGGGLGGGSSDAAATLVGLSTLWGLPLDRALLLPLAARLGSDVPFFLYGGTARGTGRGEIVDPLPDREPAWLVLALPPWPIATADVYRLLEAAAGPELTDRGSATNLPGSGPESYPDCNDLEGAAERLRGELVVLRNALRDAGATQARLAGSGSTLFGVFPDRDAALHGANRLESPEGGVRTLVVKSLIREEFRRRAFPPGSMTGYR